MNCKLEILFPLAFVVSTFSPLYNDPQLKCQLAFLVFSYTCWSSQPSWIRSHSHIQQHARKMVTGAELNTWLARQRPRWWKHWLGGWNIQCDDQVVYPYLGVRRFIGWLFLSSSQFIVWSVTNNKENYFIKAQSGIFFNQTNSAKPIIDWVYNPITKWKTKNVVIRKWTVFTNNSFTKCSWVYVVIPSIYLTKCSNILAPFWGCHFQTQLWHINC